MAANLRFVLAGIHDKLDAELPKSFGGRLAFWLEKVTTRELAVGTAAAFAICGILLTLAALAPAFAAWRKPLVASQAGLNKVER